MKKLGFSLILNVLIKFLAVGVGFFTTRWLLNNLSVGEYESYNLIVAYNQIILQFIDFGIPTLIQKYYTNEKDLEKLKTVWATFNGFRMGLYFLALLIILITYPLSQTQDLALILGLFTAQFIIFADTNYRSVCNSYGHSWQFSLSDFAGKALLLGFLSIGLYFNQFNSNIWLFVGASILAYTIGYIIDFIWQKKYTGWAKFDFGIIKENYKKILFLALSTIVISVYLTTDRLYLKFFGWPALDINGYSNAYKVFEIFTIIPSLTIPQIASFLKKQFESHTNPKILTIRYLTYSLFLGFFCTIFLLFFGNVILGLIDTQGKYPAAGQALQILSFAFIPMIPMLLASQITIFLGGEKYELISVSIVAVIVTMLYLLLIPTFGIVGASVATLATYSVDLVIKLYFLSKQIKASELVS